MKKPVPQWMARKVTLGGSILWTICLILCHKKVVFFLVAFPALSREIWLPADGASTQVFGVWQLYGWGWRCSLQEGALGHSVLLQHQPGPSWFWWGRSPKLEGDPRFLVSPRAGGSGSVQKVNPGCCSEAWSETVHVLQLQGVPDSHCCGKDSTVSRRFAIDMHLLRCIRTYTWGSYAQGERFGWGGDAGFHTSFGNPSSQIFCRWRARHLVHPLAGSPTKAGCPWLNNQQMLRQ